MNGNINELKKLIEYYENNKNTIHSNWNETETRIELINPLFECLGWDVRNNQNLADPFKEVKHEASLKIGEHMKAPDYSFSYGKRLFFLEAKKPSVDIKNDINPSYQLRRYGWTAKLPISILTNFEDLAIYDCRIKPSHNDSAGIARIKYYTYAEYIDKWDDIYNLISKDAILHGSLNDFENKQLKGTDSIDDDFLNSIENWRKLLALNIASRNPELSEKDLNFAVQMIIDRIIFLRICEDRGIENYGLLKDLINKDSYYENLLTVFQKADDKYNSGLFHFKTEKDRAETPDNITPKLKIDDKVLKEIIKDLYYPDCPYELSVISSDVLGSVYERFLGKVIRLTEGHHAKVEEKPEVRKAGGVYYTPKYIVNYIVKNTVGEIIKDKTAIQVSNIKILDPACGSGSFLIEAYQYLLDWHLNYYLNNDPDKWKKGKEPKIFEGKTGLHLTLSERKSILKNNIFGVDIDKNAVEVTKLSLLLKVLEYEGLEVQQKSLFNERVLPDLYNNIKCGNSLIGSDYYKKKDLSLFGNDDMQKINVFDWEKEFKEIMGNGGFDCIIGNPPYIRPKNIPETDKRYIWDKFESSSNKTDIYAFFIEKAIGIIKNNGKIGLITSNTYFSLESFKKLRKIILDRCILEKLINKVPDDAFSAAVNTAIIILIRTLNLKEINNNNIEYYEIKKTNNTVTFPLIRTIPQKIFIDEPTNAFTFLWDKKYQSVLQKLNNNTDTLGNLFDIRNGIATGDDPVFIKSKKESNIDKPVLYGQDILRYGVKYSGLYVHYDPDKMTKHRKTARPATPDWFEIPEKIIIHQVGGTNIKAFLDNNSYYATISTILIRPYPPYSKYDLKYLIGILNSTLIKYWYKKQAVTNTIKVAELRKIPIYLIDLKNSNEKTIHENILSLVDSMLSTQKEFHNAKSDNDKKIFKQKIDIIDSQIDGLVYGLYGLNEDDIKVIEAGL